MSPWVERLMALVEWQPLNLAISWSEIEAELGVELPPDYKEFCEVFGQGEFSGWLEVFSSTDGKGPSCRARWRLCVASHMAREAPPSTSHITSSTARLGLSPGGTRSRPILSSGTCNGASAGPSL